MVLPKSPDMKKALIIGMLILSVTLLQFCKSKENITPVYASISNTFGSNINLSQLENYSNQAVPAYITKDNTAGNPITNAKATLGRVLFYDKNLSIDNTISCASCH